MPTTINVTLGDDDFQRAKTVKDSRGLTWEGFVKEATRCLAREREITLEGVDIANSGVSTPDPDSKPGSSDRKPRGEREREPIPDPDIRGTAREHVDSTFDWDRERTEAGVDAIMAAYDYLRDRGEATMREFVNNVGTQYPAGYSVTELERGERYRGAWWRRLVSPGLEELPGVTKPGSGGNYWTYTTPRNG